MTLYVTPWRPATDTCLWTASVEPVQFVQEMFDGFYTGMASEKCREGFRAWKRLALEVLHLKINDQVEVSDEEDGMTVVVY